MRTKDTSRVPRVLERRPAAASGDGQADSPRFAAPLGWAFGVIAVAGATIVELPPVLRTTLLPAAQAAPQAKAQGIQVGAPAPPAVFTTGDGQNRRLSEFRGRPVMLWLFATWCPSCLAGTRSVAAHFETLRADRLQIIQLELYEDLGYPGPAVAQIAKDNAGPAYPASQWLFGEASRQTSYRYDPRGVPDRYFLIDANGVVGHIGEAPSATMADILAFAHEARGMHTAR